MQANYLGTAGIVSHSEINTNKYNKLLELLGTDGMLIQFERFLNEEMLTDIISQIEDNLYENNIELPYSENEAEEDDDEYGYCPECRGSGEGMWDGSTCRVCGGSGELKHNEY